MREADTQTEKQAPCRELDAGLDPGTPGPRPGLKAGTQPVSPPGVPRMSFSIPVYWRLTVASLPGSFSTG